MNNLFLTKKLIKKAERLNAAQLAIFKKGVFSILQTIIFCRKEKQAHEEVAAMDS